ncbi:hypothetical protein NMY22_g10768 [Coprinellus aureogranulatus]|nr:hypothetical protein NMY22_g10768 [Coprinellus aureogranulatus]
MQFPMSPQLASASSGNIVAPTLPTLIRRSKHRVYLHIVDRSDVALWRNVIKQSGRGVVRASALGDGQSLVAYSQAKEDYIAFSQEARIVIRSESSWAWSVTAVAVIALGVHQFYRTDSVCRECLTQARASFDVAPLRRPAMTFIACLSWSGLVSCGWRLEMVYSNYPGLSLTPGYVSFDTEAYLLRPDTVAICCLSVLPGYVFEEHYK